MQTKEPKLRIVDIIWEYGNIRKVVNKNGNTVIQATRLYSQDEWEITTTIKLPKCANKPEWERFLFNKKRPDSLPLKKNY
jgi:hypothetical protein